MGNKGKRTLVFFDECQALRVRWEYDRYARLSGECPTMGSYSRTPSENGLGKLPTARVASAVRCSASSGLRQTGLKGVYQWYGSRLIPVVAVEPP
jgi:hypothetical protein